jgi:D-alanine transaminase
MDEKQVFLNGEFLPLSRARVSVLDRGFLFGDGVYEVIPAYGGRLFRLEHHIDRLNNSLQAIRMEPPLAHSEWREILQRLLTLNGDEDQSVYLQVTRGADSKRDHEIPKGVTPTLFAMASPIAQPDSTKASEGISAITLDDIRWRLCNVKAVTLLSNVLLKQQAFDEEATEAILIRDGQAMEGAASNLFIVSNGLIVTPPKSQYLLPGITRDLVLELAADAGIPYAEAAIGMEDLDSAEEIWLTSSTREIMAVTTLNGRTIGDGRPGPLWGHMTQLYQAYKERLRLGGEE